ncbi:MAG: hypothetical protein II891_06840 [Bacteroidales bacterium]|nr:hypothetical protein [Bacteroidales bacterium]
MAESLDNYPVIVLAYEGTEDLMRALWEKRFSGTVMILSVPEDYSVMEVLLDIVTDAAIGEDFVLVQANTVPLGPTSVETILFPAVYVSAGNGDVKYSSRVPVRLSKERVVEYLSGLKETSDFDTEKCIRDCTVPNGRPLKVSHASPDGYFFQVLSGSPCRHKVIEALLSRRFLGCSLTGWNAISDLLQDYAKSDRNE